MNSRRGNLKPAHRGYRYQDIATAYVLVRSIVDRYDEVVVDQKQVADDKIDDLEVRVGGRRVRRQFKSSEDASKPLCEAEFTASASSLRIDRLVLTYVRAGSNSADEYRLCATWAPPSASDPLNRLLEPIDAAPTLVGWPAQYFRLRSDAIWPEGADPIWTPLIEYALVGAEFGRAEVLEFCDRFIIELGLPVASAELTNPGPLESALITELSEQIGIGRYPNHRRDPSDLAALAISLANLARTQEASVTPANVERDLEILVDFGRVAQAFPLDEMYFHDRPAFRRILHDAALAGAHQLVIGPPGAGKSWELTRLADELRATGAIVARHYCYLEPGDPLVERRVTTDVFFGNLLGELLDADPTLAGAGGARYAVGIAELEATLATAASSGHPVVVIVDGLDHIARVRADAHELSDDHTDIVEKLATMTVPNGVALVIGSQPGRHLDVLRERWGQELEERLIPLWLPPDISSLADRLGLPPALTRIGMADEQDIAGIRDALAERSEGSPLYATYLVRGLVAGLQGGSIASPADWIAGTPCVGGDIAVYYSHLYRHASRQAQAIADLLGVIDFAVTDSDLREMARGPLADWVPQALAQLAPVLTTVTGQGGVRIFHESFRRFMTEELARQKRSVANALEPVIQWLLARGFYKDSKAYRFLLPALRRAGRGSDVLAHVNETFVSHSVAHAHPHEAIQRNLTLAADVAAHLRDWPALVRCAELTRAAYTCFEEGQNDWREYWATYLLLYGPEALAERLLFDGRPTLSAGDGLYVCSLTDDAGSPAPWREYLELYEPDSGDSPLPSGMSDPEGSLTQDEEEILTVVHGRLRLGETSDVIRNLVDHLRHDGDTLKPLFVRRLAARIARVTDMALLERIAHLAGSGHSTRLRISRRAAAVLRLGIADELARVGDRDAAMETATKALADADTAELAAACLSHGAWPPVPIGIDPSQSLIGIGLSEHDPGATGVREWVAAVRLCAADVPRGETILSAEASRVDGGGWYRCWLRFVIALARADAARRKGQATDVGGAFAELTRDVRPFGGKPRACDLWSIRNVIQESLVWGLTFLRTEDEWLQALGALTTASTETASGFDRDDGGPLPTSTLLEILLPHARNPIGGALIRDAIEQQLVRWEEVGTYYSTHAEHAMRLARVRHATGDSTGAFEAWARAAVFLSAYGSHKDVTLFDVIESAPALSAVSRDPALRALSDVQSLANAVDAHTDGRETKHAHNAWLRSVLDVHPAIGIAVLTRTLTEVDDQNSWPNMQAIRDVAEAVRDSGDPVLIDSLLATLRFEVEYQERGAETADERLAPVVRLISTDHPLAERALRRIAAEVSGDGCRHTEGAAARVTAVAAENGIAVPRIVLSDESPPPYGSSDRARPLPDDELRFPGPRVPPFPPNASFVDLLAGLRTAGATRRWDDAAAWDDVVLALGYHIGQLIDAGREDDARRLLRFFARDADVSAGPEHPLAKVAATLDAARYPRVAAVAYALAYTATRGGGGWRRMGDETHGHLIERATVLDPGAARQVVADEVAYALRGSIYSIGLSRHLVERLASWGEPEAAEAAWRQAFAVVKHRLPLADEYGWFARLRNDREPDWPDEGWSVDEALIALLLARMADPRLALKVNALAGLVLAIERRPDAVAAPIYWWLTRNTHATSVLAALDALGSAEAAPYPITTAIDGVLQDYAVCDLWGVRRLAAQLLMRAGRPVLGRPRETGPEIDSMSVADITQTKRRALLSADVSGVLDDIAPIWPDLPERVVRRLHSLFEAEAHREHATARYKVAYGRDGDACPPTPTLFWQVELFEITLHEALCRLAERLWASGKWNPRLENALLHRVLPNARLHLGRTASRTARPAWPSAETEAERISDLPVLGGDDPVYEGWTRLALVEHRYLPDPERSYGGPVEQITVFSGAVAIPLGETVPPDVSPLKEGNVDDWWWPEPPPPTSPARLALGPLVGLAHVVDWLGDELVLIPPTALFGYLSLAPARYGSPLLWHDSRGDAGVALRTWRVRNPNAHSRENVACEGVDLVVRPDVLEFLIRSCGVPLKELRLVRRRPVSGSPRGD